MNVLDYGIQHRVPNFVEEIVKKCDADSVSVFSNYTQKHNLDKLAGFFKIDKDSIMQKYRKFVDFNKVTFSRDDDKLKALTSMLRNPKIVSKNQNYIILYTDNKKQAEEITNKLNSNGFKA